MSISAINVFHWKLASTPLTHAMVSDVKKMFLPLKMDSCWSKTSIIAIQNLPQTHNPSQGGCILAFRLPSLPTKYYHFSTFMSREKKNRLGTQFDHSFDPSLPLDRICSSSKTRPYFCEFFSFSRLSRYYRLHSKALRLCFSYESPNGTSSGYAVEQSFVQNNVL